jgi:hypothetical protein
MGNFSLKQIGIFSAIFWLAIVILGSIVGHEEVFHYIRPAFMSLIFVIILVYSRGLPDVWKNRNDISPSRLLILGVLLAGVGGLTRLARWYLTSDTSHAAAETEFEFWFYNIGLGFGLWGGMFLLGAAKLAVQTFTPGTLLVIYAALFGILLYVDLANITVIQTP